MHKLIHRLHNSDLGILFIRIAVGVIFINAGWLKITDFESAIAGFNSMGFPSYITYIVAYSELIAGIAILLGIFARYAGIIISIIMLVAIFKVHLSNGFGLQNSGYEYALVLLLNALAIVTLGSGKYSLAHLIKK